MPSDLTPAPGEITALLGPGTRYSGKLLFEGRVRIDGDFEGSIQSDDMLIVGEDAHVQADIDVGTLIVLGGEIHGEIRARALVEIHAPARVHGDIETPRIFIDRGAVFEGRCQMRNGQPSEQHLLDGAIADALEGAQEPPTRAPAPQDEGGRAEEDPPDAREKADDDSLQSSAQPRGSDASAEAAPESTEADLENEPAK